MLCYGKKGVAAPYSIKILTQLELSKVLLLRNDFVGRCIIKPKHSLYFLFADSALE